MMKDYSPTDDMPDFTEWRTSAGGQFEYSDYIQAQVVRGKITADVLGAIVGWFWPDFIEIDGLTILASKVDKLSDLRSQGLPDEEVEYWCNFTNIDGVLPGLSVPFTAYLAGVVGDMWRVKLHEQFPTKTFAVEVVEVQEHNELSVTFRHTRR